MTLARWFSFVCFAFSSWAVFADDLTTAKVFVDDTLYQYPNIQKYVELSEGVSEKYMKFLVRDDGILPDLSGLVAKLRDAEIPWTESYYYDKMGNKEVINHTNQMCIIKTFIYKKHMVYGRK